MDRETESVRKNRSPLIMQAPQDSYDLQHPQRGKGACNLAPAVGCKASIEAVRESHIDKHGCQSRELEPRERVSVYGLD